MKGELFPFEIVNLSFKSSFKYDEESIAERTARVSLDSYNAELMKSILKTFVTSVIIRKEMLSFFSGAEKSLIRCKGESQ